MAESKAVFLDSNFLIALYNSDDTLHQRASELSSRVMDGSQRLVMSNYIWLEVVTVLSQRSGRATANAVGNNILSAGQISIIHIGDAMHNDSWEIFQNIDKKNVSFVDCSTLALLRHRGIESLLTFDTTDFGPLRQTYNFTIFG